MRTLAQTFQNAHKTHADNIAQIIITERRVETAENLIDLYLRAVGVPDSEKSGHLKP